MLAIINIIFVLSFLGALLAFIVSDKKPNSFIGLDTDEDKGSSTDNGNGGWENDDTDPPLDLPPGVSILSPGERNPSERRYPLVDIA